MPYGGNPAGSQTDQMRLLMGDTSTTNPLLSDGEVTWLMSIHTTPVRGAYQGALLLAAKYSQKANLTVGPTTINYANLAASFRALAADLAKQGGRLETEISPGPPKGDNANDPLLTDQGTWSNTRWY